MDDSMLRMQQEAVERVRQMQERARRFVEMDAQPAAETHIPLQTEKEIADAHSAHGGGLKKKSLSFLDGFGEDKEQLLLLMLAILLVRNNARIELVLALLYVAM